MFLFIFLSLNLNQLSSYFFCVPLHVYKCLIVCVVKVKPIKQRASKISLPLGWAMVWRAEDLQIAFTYLWLCLYGIIFLGHQGHREFCSEHICSTNSKCNHPQW